MQKEIKFASQRQRKQFIKKNPEFTSVTAFAQHLKDNFRIEFSGEEMLLLAGAHCESFSIIKEELEALGFKLAQREIERRRRGYKCNDNDRWYGPGSSPTHGGSGFDFDFDE